MSYCLNPTCSQPKNPTNVSVCQTCGTKLLLRDRYRVAKPLGQGGFGATFLAVDLQLPGNPLCVIKQLRPSTSDPSIFQMARELFEREATTLGRIGNHPQVPRLLDYFEENKIFYLVQEYVKGHNLQQEIKRDGPLSEAGARQFLSEILPILQYIHSQKVIHRDIKPANLIRREQDKKLVLIDFGAVKNQVSGQTTASASDQTALTSFAVGTPGFAPPEQMALRPVFASDIYALGVTCIYLLSGKSPKDLDYDAKTGEMMWQKNVDISDKFAKILSKMVEVSVRHRYQTADEVLNALDMEPYLDSLAEGLIAKPSGSSSSSNLPSSGPEVYEPPTSGKPLSATERLALSIRNRKRQSAVGGSLGNSGWNGGASPSSSPSPLQTSGSPAKKKVQRLDAETLLNAYVKGRRDFAQLNLSNLTLTEANLAGGIFHQSKLKCSNLQGANLNHADFGRSSLVNSDLRDANLERAYLAGADLQGSDLRGADLSHANLRGANLRGANLCGANLKNATVTDEQLEMAKTNWKTIFPNGKFGFWG